MLPAFSMCLEKQNISSWKSWKRPKNNFARNLRLKGLYPQHPSADTRPFCTLGIRAVTIRGAGRLRGLELRTFSASLLGALSSLLLFCKDALQLRLAPSGDAHFGVFFVLAAFAAAKPPEWLLSPVHLFYMKPSNLCLHKYDQPH